MKIELEVKVPVDSTLELELEKLGLSGFNFEILRKSLDARKKPCFLYRLLFNLPEDLAVKFISEGGAREHVPIPEISIPKVKRKRVLVVGMGPAGLLASYVLAKAGLEVVLIDRGKPVEERTRDVKLFWEKRILDENSNVQFGEGGAGTFSDGKLTTRVKDKKKHFIFRLFVECGAPTEILYESKPHVGTDNLKVIVKNFRELLKSLEVEIRFSTLFYDFVLKNQRIEEVILKDLVSGEFKRETYDYVFLAVGNSARDTFSLLKRRGVCLECKPFAVGLRVIHRQKTINRIQYGKKWFKHPNLPPADYSFTYRGRRRNVFTFCMCPGGYVICASSEKNGVVCNGMSNHKRDSGYANSAVVVQVFPEDFDNDPFNAILFQRNLERAAFVAGGSDYSMPAQKVWDFIHGQGSKELIEGGFIPEIKPARLDRLLPEEIVLPIKKAFLHWFNKVPFFVPQNATLVGVETRTSSPVRIVRNGNYSSVSAVNLYPIGEGAGYSGGITSSAIDGVNGALALLESLS